MKREEKKALEDTIIHWWTNYILSLFGELTLLDTGSFKCPLCRYFFHCRYCLIQRKKGVVCSNTPWGKIQRFLHQGFQEPKLVAKEIKFLESLRTYSHKGW